MPRLLFIHGMWSRPSVFDALRAELAAVGIESVAPALPFHDLPRGAPAPAGLGQLRLEDYVQALVPEAQALAPGLVLCGHSMGGLLAQLVAAKVRPQGLVLLAPAPSAGTGALAPAPLRALLGVATRWRWWERPTRLGERGARFAVFNRVPEAEAAPALADLTWDSGRVLAQIAFPALDRSGGARVEHRKIAVPALVLVGHEDRMTPPAVSRKTAAKLAVAGAPVTLEELPGTGHWLFHAAARPRVAAAIARFLAGL